VSAPETPEDGGTVYRIPVRNEEIDVAHHDDALAWLAQTLGAGPLTGMYRRGSELVHTPRVDQVGYVPAEDEGDEDGPAQVRTIDATGLVARINLNPRISVVKTGKSSTNRPLFPRVVAEAALAHLDEALNLPRLRGVTHVPMPRADGTLIDQPGYDAASGYLFLPTVEVPEVPLVPTPGELAAAVALLRGLFAEFVWAGEHDEANYLGLLLTPLLRLLCPPPHKLGAVMAHQPGSGKTLLSKVLHAVHGGVVRAELPRDDHELEKVLYSILATTTAPVVTFDNVSGALRSSRLDAVLTAERVSLRKLGTNDHPELANDRLWSVTGNNLMIGGDTARRTLWVTIDPQVPHPEARTGFAITDLVAHVTEHRGEVLAALLTLIAHWRAEGAHYELHSSDDYKVWSATVRAILRTAGVPGEFDHEDSRQQAVGSDDDEWATFLAALAAEIGTNASWVVGDLNKLDAAAQARLAEALPEELADAAEKARRGRFSALGGDTDRLRPISRKLGKLLAKNDGRYAGVRAVRMTGQTGHVKRWKIIRHGSGATS
jgi:hypothetical protein